MSQNWAMMSRSFSPQRLFAFDEKRPPWRGGAAADGVGAVVFGIGGETVCSKFILPLNHWLMSNMLVPKDDFAVEDVSCIRLLQALLFLYESWQAQYPDTFLLPTLQVV